MRVGGICILNLVSMSLGSWFLLFNRSGLTLCKSGYKSVFNTAEGCGRNKGMHTHLTEWPVMVELVAHPSVKNCRIQHYCTLTMTKDL